MAFQEENGRFIGTLGGYTFYKMQGKYLVRRKGGVSGERIKKDPHYARTRENNNEFKIASIMAKEILKILRPTVEKAFGPNLISRLIGILLRISKTDNVNPRGERTPAYGDLKMLAGFDFNPNCKLWKRLHVQMEHTIDRDGFSALLAGGIVPELDLNIPSGATHYKICNIILVIDLKDLQYNELVVSGSWMFGVDSKFNDINQRTIFSLDPNGKAIIKLLMLEFFQDVNNIFYNLQSFNALQIVGVDT